MKELKQMFGEELHTLKNVTYEDLQRSPELRSLVLDYTKLHFIMSDRPAGSFKKEVRDEE